MVCEEEKIREEINYTNYDIEESNADCHVGICLEDFEDNDGRIQTNDRSRMKLGKQDKIGDSTHIFNVSATDMNIATPKPEVNLKQQKVNNDCTKEEGCMITLVDYSGQ